MKKKIPSFLNLLWILPTLSFGMAHAEPPKSPNIQDFKVIMAGNPFAPLESKKTAAIVREAVKPEKPREKFTLKGISRISSGWLVVMANMKKPQEDIMVYEGKENQGGIKFLEVRKDKYDYQKTIVVIEHDMKVVRDVSDRVVVLDHGVPIAQGSYDEVSTDPDVIEAYLGRPVEAAS